MSVLILPHGEQTAISLEIPIKALNLHTRSQISDSQLSELPVSTIEIRGSFSVDDALAWLNDCLPDVPMSSTESKLIIGYKSAFLGTLLQVRVSDNFIVA